MKARFRVDSHSLLHLSDNRIFSHFHFFAALKSSSHATLMLQKNSGKKQLTPDSLPVIPTTVWSFGQVFWGPVIPHVGSIAPSRYKSGPITPLIEGISPQFLIDLRPFIAGSMLNFVSVLYLSSLFGRCIMGRGFTLHEVHHG